MSTCPYLERTGDVCGTMRAHIRLFLSSKDTLSSPGFFYYWTDGHRVKEKRLQPPFDGVSGASHKGWTPSMDMSTGGVDMRPCLPSTLLPTHPVLVSTLPLSNTTYYTLTLPGRVCTHGHARKPLILHVLRV